ncbi:MAG: hypothetical protein AB8G77_13180 [Rhodothermales bacterium]
MRNKINNLLFDDTLRNLAELLNRLYDSDNLPQDKASAESGKSLQQFFDYNGSIASPVNFDG